MRSLCLRAVAAVLVSAWAVPAYANQPEHNTDTADLLDLRNQLQIERQELKRQEQALIEQRARLERLEDQLLGRMRAAGVAPGAAVPALTQTAASPPSPDRVEEVGAKPADKENPPDVAVLADQGSIMTRAGRITIEPSLEYARSDRNRFVFRGIEVPQSVLVGVFDINESRQDLLTAALTGRFGVTNRLEIGARVPFVYRADKAVLVPLVNDPQDDSEPDVATVDDRSTDGKGIGDVEVSARYQLTNGTGGWPFLIAGVQAIIPTGRGPFEVSRDNLGNPRQSATGAGFWAVAPNLTILQPSDPATLFASFGYTFNFGKTVDQKIGDAIIDRVKPGGAPNATVGVGLALNPELSLSFAYAHTWQFATKTRIRLVNSTTGAISDPITTNTRDLQVGRFLFGLGYRVNPRTTINWTVEMGATDDANDVRTTLRIPFTLN